MPIDLRSDTVTRPSAGMRAAMAAAEVGDDVYGDDPTVNELQRFAAERLGHEAALFFPSGTQSNLAALMTHCQRGDEVILGEHAHTYQHEGGGAAVLGSIQPQPLEQNLDGTIDLDRIREAVKPGDDHFARTRLLAVPLLLVGGLAASEPLAHAEVELQVQHRCNERVRTPARRQLRPGQDLYRRRAAKRL